MIRPGLYYNRLIRESLFKVIAEYGIRPLKSVFVWFGVIFIFSAHVLAQNESIRNIEIRSGNDTLNVACHFEQDFIDEDMRQTLTSGMSSSFNFQINLKYENGSVIRSRLSEVAIRYDVWEKHYLLFYNNQIYQFTQYPDFKSFLYDSLTFSLGTDKGLDKNRPLRVILLFSPEKISPAQKEKLNYWLTNNPVTEESAPGNEEGSGFSIDLSKLFSVFLSNDSKTKIQKYRSGIFTITALRKYEKPAQ